LAGARDGGPAECLIALRFAFQEPKLFAGSIVSGADKVVTAHGHVAAVLVAEAAHGDAKADFFLDQFGREDFAEVAGPTLGRLRHCGAEDFTSYLESESLHILGDAFESIVVRADGFGEVVADLVAAAILLDICPIMLALVFFRSEERRVGKEGRSRGGPYSVRHRGERRVRGG